MPHFVCEPRNWTRREGRSAYDPKMMIGLFLPRLLHGLPLNRNEINAVLTDYLREEPSKSFTARVLKFTREQYSGGEKNILRSLPQYIEQLKINGHNAKLITIDASEMTEVAIKMEKQIHMQHIKYLKEHEEKPIFDEQNLREKIQQSISKNTKFGYALLFSPSYSKAIIDKLIPVFSSDAAQCFGETRGNMFTFYGRDVNHRQILLAVMFIADNENEKTWTIFLDFVSTSVKKYWKGRRIITDQDKGSDIAVEKSLHGAQQFYCSHHRKTNVFKNADTSTGKYFSEALNAWTDKKLTEIKRKYSEKGKMYLEKISDEKQYPFKRGKLYGMSTSQGAESMNNANKKFRLMGIYSGYVKFIEEDQRRFLDAKKWRIKLMFKFLSQESKKNWPI